MEVAFGYGKEKGSVKEVKALQNVLTSKYQTRELLSSKMRPSESAVRNSRLHSCGRNVRQQCNKKSNFHQINLTKR